MGSTEKVLRKLKEKALPTLNFIAGILPMTEKKALSLQSLSAIIDKEGKYIVSLKTGTHTIAVKVVDNNGLENIEIIKLKINRTVEQVKEMEIRVYCA